MIGQRSFVAHALAYGAHEPFNPLGAMGIYICCMNT